MKIFQFLIACIALSFAGLVVANEIVCNDKLIPSTKKVSLTLSKKYTAQPTWLSVTNAVPTTGNVTVSWHHAYADASIQTNTTTVALTNGTARIKLGDVFADKYVFPGEALTIQFSAATNGAFQIIGELLK